MSSYSLTVLGIDQGQNPQTASTTVSVEVIDVNDNKPVFEQQVYRVNILEKSPVNSVIVYSRATDADSGSNANLTYTLQSTTGAHRYFSMQPQTGIISIRETIHRTSLMMQGIMSVDNVLSMKVIATDAGQVRMFGEAVVLVTVNEVNDDNPEFANITYRVYLREEVGAGKFIIQLIYDILCEYFQAHVPNVIQ